ncbi:MAG TPA: fused MFS/spermidine synthase [Bryobacteraceae bacterium]|nr:fused MFS/spermidine synthase [Bryobacteraceae bacterium]
MQSAKPSLNSNFLFLLLLLFGGSGCAALIYEIVWYQLLQLAIGSTAVSIGMLLATFMGGLCIGSIALPRMRLPYHPLRIYAALEAGIAMFGVLIVFSIPLIDRIYFAGAGYGLPGMLLRGLMCAICLLPPTILMGASLPIIVKWIEATPNGVAWWGLLYGANTVGAVFGSLFAGFYLLRLYDVVAATFAAAFLNVAIAAISYLAAARTPEHTYESPLEPASKPSGDRAIYIAIALSGAIALGGEVVWTRLIAMLLGSTVYVFSIILAVFLIGLAIGSAAASSLLRNFSSASSARSVFGWCQFLLTLAIAWTAYMIADALPYLPINPLMSTNPWYMFQLDVMRCLWAILPPTLLFGASFPLALASIASPEDDPGRLVGGIYAANTLGAIAGALVVSLALIPWIGTQNSQRILLMLAAVSGILVLAPQLRSRSTVLAVTAAAILAGALTWQIDPVPGELIAYGRRIATYLGSSRVLYTVEGRNSSVAITQWHDGATEIDVNGHVEATNEPFDMKLQRMVGHLPGLLHPDPKSVLGIGFGAGVSAGTFTRYPGIQHITVCEIEPVIPPTSTRFFAREDYEVFHNPRTHVVFDDARHYLLTTKDKFDVIASDPLDVFVKGTAGLYSKEYFESVRQHLNPGGIFTLYVPLYETDEKTIRSELATFFAAFPYGTIWANTWEGRGYDMVFMGQAEPLKVNLDDVQQRLERPDYAPVAQSLRDIGVASVIDLLATYAGQKTDFDNWLAGAEINRDRDLRLQYLAGWGINSTLEDVLYRQIISYRRPPSNLITGSPERLQSLIVAMQEPR